MARREFAVFGSHALVRDAVARLDEEAAFG